MKLCTDCFQHRADGSRIKCHASFVCPVTGESTGPYDMTCAEARSLEWACGAEGRHWVDRRKMCDNCTGQIFDGRCESCDDRGEPIKMHGTTAHKEVMEEVNKHYQAGVDAAQKAIDAYQTDCNHERTYGGTDTTCTKCGVRARDFDAAKRKASSSTEPRCKTEGHEFKTDGGPCIYCRKTWSELMDEVQPYRPLTPDELHELTIQVHKELREEEEHDRPTIPDVEKHAPEWATHYVKYASKAEHFADKWFFIGPYPTGDGAWKLRYDLVPEHLCPTWPGPWQDSLTLIRRR